MKLISKKNFFPTVCIVYTVLSILKILLESFVFEIPEGDYENFIWMLAISVVATFVLSLHYYLQKFPLWLVIIGQYLVLLALIMLCVWISGNFAKMHPDAYRDMFWSFTIPYIFGALLYYLSLWNEMRKANIIINNLKKQNIKEV